MTNEQAKHKIDLLDFYLQNYVNDYGEESHTAMMMAIKALEQQTCEDAVSRQAVLDIFADNADVVRPYSKTWEEVKALPSVNPQSKIGHCKDCRWWKDSDGVYRRGVGAESQCPINCREVYEGNGYCFMFAEQERSDEE